MLVRMQYDPYSALQSHRVVQPKMDITDMLFLKRLYPSLVRASGIAVHQGIALVGPPGCGKTHLALAAIGESGLRCIQ